MLEENGIVGPADGSKPRQLLLADTETEEVVYEDAEGDQEKREKWNKE